jgi:hypothetical protein
MTDWHLGNLPPQRYDAALVARCRLADLMARPFVPKPVAPAPEPPPFVPPAKGRPIDIAVAFLTHKLASRPAQVNILLASAAAFGISESTVRRAKKALSLKAIRRDDEWLWGFGGASDTT